MIKFIKSFFSKKEEAVEAPAPYKVDTPTPVSEQATQAVVESIAPAKPAKAKKEPAAKKAPAAKKPRAPKAPK